MAQSLDFQIVIPLTGNGSRFKEAGYSRLKPFIEIEGRALIEWVVRMFPGDERRILFLARKEHLDTLDYALPTLKRVAPEARILALEHWEKLGPVSDLLRASEFIDDSKGVLVSYCDYYMHWDYAGFKAGLLSRNPDGAIPCYTGFHPHLLPKKNLYASCRVDGSGNLLEIREKFSFSEDKTQALHSPGAYYFKSGALMKSAARALVDSGAHLNGEYYVSLVYNELLRRGLEVWVPALVSRFCQWGSPEDLEESLFWIQSVKRWA